MLIFVLLSFLVLCGFIVAGVLKFGLLTSYSSYADRWSEAVPIPGMHLWSVATFAAAFLMIPAMIEAGAESPAQCLGFFAPLYLIVVSLTPEYTTQPAQRRVHVMGATACALFAFAWILFVCKLWPVVAVVAVIFSLAAYFLKRADAFIFWGEVTLFLSAYITLLFALL